MLPLHTPLPFPSFPPDFFLGSQVSVPSNSLTHNTHTAHSQSVLCVPSLRFVFPHGYTHPNLIHSRFPYFTAEDLQHKLPVDWIPWCKAMIYASASFMNLGVCAVSWGWLVQGWIHTYELRGLERKFRFHTTTYLESFSFSNLLSNLFLSYSHKWARSSVQDVVDVLVIIPFFFPQSALWLVELTDSLLLLLHVKVPKHKLSPRGEQKKPKAPNPNPKIQGVAPLFQMASTLHPRLGIPFMFRVFCHYSAVLPEHIEFYCASFLIWGSGD